MPLALLPLAGAALGAGGTALGIGLGGGILGGGLAGGIAGGLAGAGIGSGIRNMGTPQMPQGIYGGGQSVSYNVDNPYSGFSKDLGLPGAVGNSFVHTTVTQNPNFIPQLSDVSGSPDTAALQRRLDSLKTPDKISLEGPYQSKETAYQAKDLSGPLPEFNSIRTRANTQLNQAQQQSQDALDRQFAALGGGPSGAQIKQTQILGDSMAKQRDQTMQDINFQEAQQRRALQEEEQNKQFQSEEALKGRTFQGEQGALSRNLAANQFNSQMGSQFDQFAFDASSKISALDQSYRQANLSTLTSALENEYNAKMNAYQAAHSGGLFGGGGFLGLGF